MPTTLTWQIAVVLIADGFLLGLGLFLASGFLSWLGGLIAARRGP